MAKGSLINIQLKISMKSISLKNDKLMSKTNFDFNLFLFRLSINLEVPPTVHLNLK